MIDENALGALVSYVGIEDDEYENDDTEVFVQKFARFRSVCLEMLKGMPPAPNTSAIFLGHALYVEFAETDERPRLLAFVRSVRDELRSSELHTAGILTFGGRWVNEEEQVEINVTEQGDCRIADVSLPSEPLRKALQAEAACHGMGAEPGWGVGLYFDADVLEPLGLNLKNEPTPLSAGDATFFRVGR